MKVACLGGGPAGLYFAISMKLRDAGHDITVFERNRPDDTFGWGVVFSDETFDNITANDPVSAAAIRGHFAYWDDIAVYYRGERIVSSGHGFSGIGRKKLLMLLQERARQLGVDLRFQAEIADVGELAKDYDVVIAADGLNSRTRVQFADYFKPAIDTRKNKFVWLGTRSRNSMTPSPLFSKRPSTAGSGRMPISSMPTPRPSSSNVPKRPGRKPASAQ